MSNNKSDIEALKSAIVCHYHVNVISLIIMPQLMSTNEHFVYNIKKLLTASLMQLRPDSTLNKLVIRKVADLHPAWWHPP